MNKLSKKKKRIPIRRNSFYISQWLSVTSDNILSHTHIILMDDQQRKSSQGT